MAYALLIAGKGGKRSRLAREVADALAGRGLRVGGFTQRVVEPTPGARTVEAVRLRGGGAIVLARSVSGGDADACTFAFDRAALEEAGRWIEADAADADVLVVDGLGKVELGGEGNRATLARALASRALVVLAVRDDQLVYAMEALGLGEPVAAYAEGEGAEALRAFLAEIERMGRPCG